MRLPYAGRDGRPFQCRIRPKWFSVSNPGTKGRCTHLTINAEYAKSPTARVIALVGFMGAGKTSVGRALAAMLGCRFVDLDDLIVARERKSVADIFTDHGEAYFRQAEAHELDRLLTEAERPLVLSLGGGAFMAELNREALRRAQAITVRLAAPVEELHRRIGESPERPLARDGDKFKQLYEQRQQAYALADLTVETMDKAVDEVAAEIADKLAARATAIE